MDPRARRALWLLLLVASMICFAVLALSGFTTDPDKDVAEMGWLGLGLLCLAGSHLARP